MTMRRLQYWRAKNIEIPFSGKASAILAVLVSDSYLVQPQTNVDLPDTVGKPLYRRSDDKHHLFCENEEDVLRLCSTMKIDCATSLENTRKGCF